MKDRIASAFMQTILAAPFLSRHSLEQFPNLPAADEFRRTHGAAGGLRAALDQQLHGLHPAADDRRVERTALLDAEGIHVRALGERDLHHARVVVARRDDEVMGWIAGAIELRGRE